MAESTNNPQQPQPTIEIKPNLPTGQIDQIEGDEGSASGRLSGTPTKSSNPPSR